MGVIQADAPLFAPSQMSLVAVASTPTRTALSDMSKTTSEPPMLLASAETYAAHELFGGQWAPTIADSELERKHNTLLDFYVKEVEQRHFYGFIDFGCASSKPLPCMPLVR